MEKRPAEEERCMVTRFLKISPEYEMILDMTAGTGGLYVLHRTISSRSIILPEQTPGQKIPYVVKTFYQLLVNIYTV